MVPYNAQTTGVKQKAGKTGYNSQGRPWGQRGFRPRTGASQGAIEETPADTQEDPVDENADDSSFVGQDAFRNDQYLPD